MKKQKPFDLSVYFIADPSVCAGRSVLDVVYEAVQGGATMVQYRNKTGNQHEIMKDAKLIANLLRPLGIPFIVNDDVGVAKLVKADGVHVGQTDLTPKQARVILEPALGPDVIIGLTAYEPGHFQTIDADIVDYVGIGPVYPTKTKPDKPVLGLQKFSQLAELSPVPVVGVGGITPETASAVISAGAAGVAMMRAISESKDPKAAAESFVKAMQGPLHDPEYLQHRRL